MEGVRVVEVGMWVAGPSASAVLGDWGADVVKIEPPEGDPFRGLISSFGGDGSSPPFELDNRNKRSVGLNLAHDEGRRIAAQLVDQADVFVTNARLGALERAGLDYATVSARNPRLVYAIITGYGVEGEDRGRAAYDVGAFWSRAGVAAALTPEGDDLPYQRGGMGDHMAGMAAAGAVAAALLARERTGEGQLVSTSLLRIGITAGYGKREREIVQLLAEGKSTKEVAVALGLSVKTAETHRSNIMRKLQLHSVSDLVLYAVRNNIVHVVQAGIE